MSFRPKRSGVEKSHQYKKVIAKRTVGLRPTNQTKMSQGSILSVLIKRIRPLDYARGDIKKYVILTEVEKSQQIKNHKNRNAKIKALRFFIQLKY